VCFDFVPQHHNIIRYRRGIAVIKDDFHTVCSWVQFKNKEAWKYDLFLGKNLCKFVSYVAIMASVCYQTITTSHSFMENL
jgi:hypothetical protein